MSFLVQHRSLLRVVPVTLVGVLVVIAMRSDGARSESAPAETRVDFGELDCRQSDNRISVIGSTIAAAEETRESSEADGLDLATSDFYRKGLSLDYERLATDPERNGYQAYATYVDSVLIGEVLLERYPQGWLPTEVTGCLGLLDTGSAEGGQ